MSKQLNALLMVLEQTIVNGLKRIENGDHEEGGFLLETAIRELENILKHKNNNEARFQLSVAYYYQGYSRYQQGMLKQARESIEQSQMIFKDIETDWHDSDSGHARLNYANTFKVLADIESDEGNHQAAYECSKKCYNLLTKLRKERSTIKDIDLTILLCLSHLSTYAYMAKSEDALEYTKRYLKAYVKFYGTDYDPVAIADIYERLSLLYRLEGDSKKERKYLRQAVKILLPAIRNNKNDLTAKVLLGQAYDQLGEIKKDEGNLEAAKTAYNRALTIFKEAWKISGSEEALIVRQVELEMKLAQIFHQMGDEQSRMKLLKEATHSFRTLLPLNPHGAGKVARIEELYSQVLKVYTQNLVEMGEYAKANSAFDDFYVFIAAWNKKGLVSPESMAADLKGTLDLQLELLGKALDQLENDGELPQAIAVCDAFLESLGSIDGAVGQFSVNGIRRDVERRRALLEKKQ